MEQNICTECNGTGKVLDQIRLEEEPCEKCGGKGFYYNTTAYSTTMKVSGNSTRKLIIIGVVMFAAVIGLGFVAIKGGFISGSIQPELIPSFTEPQGTDNKPIIIHIHTKLKIMIQGKPVAITKKIGIDPSLYKSHDLDEYGIKDPRTYPLHTHDTSGRIHIESTVERTFTLGQFFDVWGVTFNENCIMDRCSNEWNNLRMYVNGNESLEFREHVLKDGEVIRIEYGLPRGEFRF